MSIRVTSLPHTERPPYSYSPVSKLVFKMAFFRNVSPPKFCMGFCLPFLVAQSAQPARFYYLPINKTNSSFSVFLLLTYFATVTSWHSVFHFFAHRSIFRVEKLSSLESEGSTLFRTVCTIYQATRYQIPEYVI